MIKPGNIWHSPLNVYWHLNKLAKEVGSDIIEADRKYQTVREARIGAIVAMGIFKKTKKPTYLQLYKPDPPDLIFMQQTNETRDITQIEITSYTGKLKESLLDQLKRKDPPGYHKYSDNYILVVSLGIGMKVDFEPIGDYLNSNVTPYPIWVIQEVPNKPNTSARLTILNPKMQELEIDIGEAANEMQKLKLPGVINSIRVGNPKLVRAKYTGENYQAPWETIGK